MKFTFIRRGEWSQRPNLTPAERPLVRDAALAWLARRGHAFEADSRCEDLLRFALRLEPIVRLALGEVELWAESVE